jgi:hypothetical protein
MSGRLLILLIAIWAAAGSTALRAQESESWAPSWLLNSPYSPSFNVQDTVNKYGRYADRPKAISSRSTDIFAGG